LRALVESIIQLKNPQFKFDANVSLGLIVKMAFSKIIAFLRTYPIWFSGSFPMTIFFGKGIKLLNTKKISFGKWTQIGDFVKISALGKEGVYLGNNFSIGDFSRIIVATSFHNIGNFIKIGNNVGIGEFAYLGGAGGLTIGNNVIVGQYFSCHPENHNFDDLHQLIRLQGTSRKGIEIGDNCWIGSKVTILDGVQIGEGSIVAAGSVVNKSYPPNSIIGGVPAKLLKERNELNAMISNLIKET